MSVRSGFLRLLEKRAVEEAENVLNYLYDHDRINESNDFYRGCCLCFVAAPVTGSFGLCL